MTHEDHVRLIREGIVGGGVWADFGSGEGAFTLALADILGSSGSIISIEKDGKKLSQQEKIFAKTFPSTDIQFFEADFTKPLNLPKLDGILCANSLHFYKKKLPLFTQFGSYVKKGGRLVVVEYNVDVGNVFVPYPFSFGTFLSLAQAGGFQKPHLLTTIASGFLNEMYTAVAIK